MTKKLKKLFLVIQEGGSTGEVYLHPHGSVEEAKDDMESCNEAAYRTVGPIEVPPALTKLLLGDAKAEEEFYTIAETLLRAAAKNF